MSTFGWCATGHHKSCRVEIGTTSNGIARCECSCHKEAA